MRTFALLLTLLTSTAWVVSAQEADAPDGSIIKSAQVSGFPFDQLSPGLRQSISALVGERLDRQRVNELAARIEAEHPEVIAAVRSLAAADGEARVAFLVGRISDDEHLVANINARYTVESVEIAGVPETQVSQELRDQLQALVGGRLDPDEARRLDGRLSAELPGYDVHRRISRGTQPGRIRVVFDVSKAEEPRWIPFAASTSKLLHHSDQGWTGALDVPMGGRDNRFTLGLVSGNSDDLIEEYSGYSFRFEGRKVAATERLGLSMAFSRYHQDWEDSTLETIASSAGSESAIPEAYGVRSTVSPLVTFAFTPHFRLSAGFSASELESLSDSSTSQMASAAVASLGYKPALGRRIESASERGREDGASFCNHLAAERPRLQTVFRAKQLSGPGKAAIRSPPPRLGRISGRAPLFERFSLGDSTTLRGWNKFDIAPAGGDRMFHQSLEYNHSGIAFFVDTGSVWERETDLRVRVSTGFGYHRDNVFFTLGFPVNSTDLGPTLIFGVRF